MSLVASLDMVLSENANNKGAEQIARMRRLVCACVVCKPPKTGFLSSDMTIMMLINGIQRKCELKSKIIIEVGRC